MRFGRWGNLTTGCSGAAWGKKLNRNTSYALADIFLCPECDQLTCATPAFTALCGFNQLNLIRYIFR